MPSEEDRATVTGSIWWNLDVCFFEIHEGTDRQTDTLMAILCTPTGGEVNIPVMNRSVAVVWTGMDMPSLLLQMASLRLMQIRLRGTGVSQAWSLKLPYIDFKVAICRPAEFAYSWRRLLIVSFSLKCKCTVNTPENASKHTVSKGFFSGMAQVLSQIPSIVAFAYLSTSL